jgi:hypothetical protein
MGGGFVAAADFDGDGKAEWIVTPDEGGGPRVSIFSLNGNDPFLRANYFTVDPTFRGGARAAAGDLNGDGTPDLAVAAGFGGGPRVSIIDGKKAITTNGFNPADRLTPDFFALDDSLRNGVYLAIGDLDGDGRGDLIVGAGPGGAPRLLVISGAKLLADGAVPAIGQPLSNFFVGGQDGNRAGVRVTAADFDNDGLTDIAVSSGAGVPADVRIYSGKDFGSGEPTTHVDINPFEFEALTDGLYVG